MSTPAFVMTDDDYRQAERKWRRAQNEALDPANLATEIGHWAQELALLTGDLEARDFSASNPKRHRLRRIPFVRTLAAG